MDQNDYQRMDPMLSYSRRYVVVGKEQREILDTWFYSINAYYTADTTARAALARELVLTRYPNRQAAREAELSLNGLELKVENDPESDDYPSEEELNTLPIPAKEG